MDGRRAGIGPRRGTRAPDDDLLDGKEGGREGDHEAVVSSRTDDKSALRLREAEPPRRERVASGKKGRKGEPPPCVGGKPEPGLEDGDVGTGNGSPRHGIDDPSVNRE